MFVCRFVVRDMQHEVLFVMGKAKEAELLQCHLQLIRKTVRTIKMECTNAWNFEHLHIRINVFHKNPLQLSRSVCIKEKRIEQSIEKAYAAAFFLIKNYVKSVWSVVSITTTTRTTHDKSANNAYSVHSYKSKAFALRLQSQVSKKWQLWRQRAVVSEREFI